MRIRSIAVLIAAAGWMALGGVRCEAKKTPPAPHSIELNAASEDQLEELPGIGPARAGAIVEFRKKSGPFHSVNDLLVVHGISRKELEKIRPYIYVKGPAAPAGKGSATRSPAKAKPGTAPS